MGEHRPDDEATVHREVISTIFGEGTGSQYDEIIEITLEGRDKAWKEELLKRVPSAYRVLDLACGTGIFTRMIRARFPDAEIIGVDINAEYQEIARRNAAEAGDTKVSFLLGAAEEVELTGTFDLITSCYLPKYVDLDIMVPRWVELLEPGGMLIMQDFCWPSDRFVVEFLENRFEELQKWSKESMPEALGMFEALPAVIRESNWIEEMSSEMVAAGMVDIGRHYMDLEQSALVWGRKPGISL